MSVLSPNSLAAVVLLLAGCAGATKTGGTYTAPLGNFTCGPFDRPTKADGAFGPHGGTVRLVDDNDWARIDVEELSPPVAPGVLEETRTSVYRDYLTQHIIPLVQSGVPEGKLVDARLEDIAGHTVLLSAMLVPEGSGMVDSNGKRLDGMRGQVQYTNGRFMYTLSRILRVAPDITMEQQVERAYGHAKKAFRGCTFP